MRKRKYWLIWIVVGWSIAIGASLGASPIAAQMPSTPTPTPTQTLPAVDRTIAQITIRHLQDTVRSDRAPVVTRTQVIGNYAIANWMRAQVGGQAVLLCSDNRWSVVQSGGGVINRAALIRLGVPPQTADQLLRR